MFTQNYIFKGFILSAPFIC